MKCVFLCQEADWFKLNECLMVDFNDALKIIIREAYVLGKEQQPLHDCTGRVLAQDVLSDIDMPPFNRSAMDGFACRRSDLANRLEITGTVRAGDIPKTKIGKYQCVRIMTGSQVPEGADCVIMKEHTVSEGEGYIRFSGRETSNNIAYRGEDLGSGDMALAAGTLIKPQHIAILASAGCTRPLVFKRPVVAVLATGDEIVEPDEKPEGTFIRNSNGPQVVAQIRSMGALPRYMGIVKDTPEMTDASIKSSLSGSDVVVITGGVSMGDFDFVPSVLKNNGVKLFFEKVAIKPGRPTVFGRKGNVPVFGLPGNPVSAFIIFELMVKPLLYGMMGHEFQPGALRMPIGTDYSVKKADRLTWIPVNLNILGELVPAGYHGSAHIQSLAGAWGLMGMEAGIYSYKKGEIVNVRPI
jgi:molybdopterin molybdotransferase